MISRALRKTNRFLIFGNFLSEIAEGKKVVLRAFLSILESESVCERRQRRCVEAEIYFLWREIKLRVALCNCAKRSLAPPTLGRKSFPSPRRDKRKKKNWQRWDFRAERRNSVSFANFFHHFRFVWSEKNSDARERVRKNRENMKKLPSASR